MGALFGIIVNFVIMLYRLCIALFINSSEGLGVTYEALCAYMLYVLPFIIIIILIIGNKSDNIKVKKIILISTPIFLLLNVIVFISGLIIQAF